MERVIHHLHQVLQLTVEGVVITAKVQLQSKQSHSQQVMVLAQATLEANQVHRVAPTAKSILAVLAHQVVLIVNQIQAVKVMQVLT
jgi:hypothetical protein